MIAGFDDYRSYLKSVLADRMGKNPAYSLRRMAAQLGLAPSTFSDVLKGRKNLSESRAHQIAHRLQLSGDEVGEFVQLTTQDRRRSGRRKITKSHHAVTLLRDDEFRLIADWYHMVVAELPRLSNEPIDCRAIAKRLGLREVEVEVALERLGRLGVLKQLESGRWIQAPMRWVASSEISSEALRKFHVTMLEKAKESLIYQHPQDRVNGSETLAFDPKNLNKARQIIEDCFEKIHALSKRGKATTVFHLGIQFFDVLTTSKEKKS